jgi:hypothetical protein
VETIEIIIRVVFSIVGTGIIVAAILIAKESHGDILDLACSIAVTVFAFFLIAFALFGDIQTQNETDAIVRQCSSLEDIIGCLDENNLRVTTK